MPTREANDDSFPQFVQYFMMASRLRMRIPSLPSLREFIKTFVRASGRVAGSMKCFAVPLLFNKTFGLCDRLQKKKDRVIQIDSHLCWVMQTVVILTQSGGRQDGRQGGSYQVVSGLFYCKRFRSCRRIRCTGVYLSSERVKLPAMFLDDT